MSRLLQGRRTQGIGLLAILITFGCCLSGLASPQHRTSQHFEIYYEDELGAGAGSYARLVEQSMELAYDFFSTEGFAIFQGLIQVDIVDAFAGELGAEYLEIDELGDWIPRIEIGNESVMREYLSYAYTETSLEDLVASTCAHELFHAIQDYHSLHSIGDISEQSFVEAQATAIQEAVVPTANAYLEPALDFLLAPDSMAFFQRSYDAGIFWVYVLDRFGIRAFLDLMHSSSLYDGRYAIDHAFSSSGLSFFDIWSDFAMALATGALPDFDVIATLVPEAEGPGWWTRTRDSASIPSVVFRDTWTGTRIDIEMVNAANQSEYTPLYEDDAIGTRLRVAHAYGIDILDIELDETTSMTIQFNGDSGTQFRTAIAAETNDGWSSTPFATTISVQPDETTTRIRIIITRSEAGTGEYTITIQPAT